MGRVPLYQLAINTVPRQYVWRPIWLRQFFKRSFLFSGDTLDCVSQTIKTNWGIPSGLNQELDTTRILRGSPHAENLSSASVEPQSDL